MDLSDTEDNYEKFGDELTDPDFYERCDECGALSSLYEYGETCECCKETPKYCNSCYNSDKQDIFCCSYCKRMIGGCCAHKCKNDNCKNYICNDCKRFRFKKRCELHEKKVSKINNAYQDIKIINKN